MMLRLLFTEFLKLKRSYVWLMMAGAPIVMVVFGAANFVRYRNLFLKNGAVPWEKLVSQVSFFYGSLLLPLSIAVLAVWLARIEHGENNWKHLFALPVRRGAVYAAKSLVHLVLVGLSLAVLYVGVIVAARLISAGPVPFADWSVRVAVAWAACLPILAVQMWLSWRFPSVGIPVGVGVAASVAGILAANSSYGKYYLWSYPTLILTPGSSGMQQVSAGFVAAVSLAAYVVVSVLAYLDFRRAEVQ